MHVCTYISQDIFHPDSWLPIDCNEVYKQISYVCEYPPATHDHGPGDGPGNGPGDSPGVGDAVGRHALLQEMTCRLGWTLYDGHCIILQRYNYSHKEVIQSYQHIEMKSK